MAELIHQMSQIQVPDDLLRQVDIAGLLNEFRDKFKRLDDFRDARQTYENRGAGKKLLDALTFDKTLENAELDAVEAQADFSKAIGQLMVVSLVQSQRLQQQQELLAEQQGIIKAQTQRIECQALELHNQQGMLAKQNAELEELVNDYFELKGLTLEGAKKLISIANDVQSTRDSLLSSVEASMASASTQLNQALDQVSQQVTTLKAHVDQGVSDIEQRCAETASDFKGHREDCSSQLAGFRVTTSSVENKVTDMGRELASQSENLDGLSANLAANLESVVKEFSAYRDAMQVKFRAMSLALAGMAIGLAGTVYFFAGRL